MARSVKRPHLTAMDENRAEDLLREAFRHNAWATRKLLGTCRGLSAEELRATPPGTYGTVLEVLNHIISGDAGYLPRVAIERPAWADDEDDVEDFDQLEARVEECAALWERYLSDPLPADQVLILDRGAYEAQSSVPVVQALHHANAHREQVCALLTGLGREAPDLQAWEYAHETGRGRDVPEAERRQK